VFMNVDRLISFGVWYYHFFYPCLIFMHKVLKARYCISADIMHAVVGSVCVFYRPMSYARSEGLGY